MDVLMVFRAASRACCAVAIEDSGAAGGQEALRGIPPLGPGDAPSLLEVSQSAQRLSPAVHTELGKNPLQMVFDCLG